MNSATQTPLQLEVTNLGPIVEAKIDLRPLTVFVGPSNTGKSYLAILIYALHRFFSRRGWVNDWIFEEDGIRKPPEKTIDALTELAEQVLTGREQLPAEGNIVLPAPVTDTIRYLLRIDAEEAIDLALPQLADPLNRPAFYLPADRTGLMHAHRVAVGSLINRASRAGLRRDDPLPDLSGVVADFLEQLIGLGGLSGHRRDRADVLAKQIERAILGGSVQIKTSETGYPQFFYEPDGWKNSLPLMNTSSMVSELAPLVMYLRHVVQPGNVLIIEEPECKKKITGKREEAKVEAKVLHLLERYLMVEEFLGLTSVNWDQPREAPYPVASDLGEADLAAHRLRSYWGLGLDPIPPRARSPRPRLRSCWKPRPTS